MIKAIVKDACNAINSDKVIRKFIPGDIVEIYNWDNDLCTVEAQSVVDGKTYIFAKDVLKPFLEHHGVGDYILPIKTIYYEHQGILAKEDRPYQTINGWYTVNGPKKEVMFVAPSFSVGDKVTYRNFNDIMCNNQYTVYTILSLEIKHNQYKYCITADGKSTHNYYEQDLIPAPKFEIGDRVTPTCIIEVCDCHVEYIQSMRYKRNDGWVYSGSYMKDVLEDNIRKAPKYSYSVGKYESIDGKQVSIKSNAVWDSTSQQYRYLAYLNDLVVVGEHQIQEYLQSEPKYLIYIRDKKKYRIITNVSPSIIPYIGKITSKQEYDILKVLIDIQHDEDVKQILSKKLEEMKKR